MITAALIEDDPRPTQGTREATGGDNRRLRTLDDRLRLLYRYTRCWIKLLQLFFRCTARLVVTIYNLLFLHGFLVYVVEFLNYQLV